MNDVDKSAKALTDFAQGPAKDAANEVAEYFELAGKRMANALERAALSGEFSIRDMAAAISKDLASIAIKELLIDPLEAVLGGAFGGGGTGSTGSTSPINPVNIVMNLSGVSDVSGFTKSQGQISASLARAVAQGQKFT